MVETWVGGWVNEGWMDGQTDEWKDGECWVDV